MRSGVSQFTEPISWSTLVNTFEAEKTPFWILKENTVPRVQRVWRRFLVNTWSTLAKIYPPFSLGVPGKQERPNDLIRKTFLLSLVFPVCPRCYRVLHPEPSASTNSATSAFFTCTKALILCIRYIKYKSLGHLSSSP